MTLSPAFWTLALVALLDLAIPYLLAPRYPGYSHRTMVMSVLGGPLAPRWMARLYGGWLVAGGIGFSLGAVWLHRNLGWRAPGAGRVALVLLLAYALGGMVLAGLFPAGADKEAEGLSARVHGAGAALGFLALLFAGIPLALVCFRAGWRGTGAGCLVCSFLGLAAFVLFVLADKEALAGTWVRREGSWQRLSLLLMYLPPILTAARLG